MAKILIVDDDGIVRDALTVFLTRSGHETETAADGINGLIAFKSAAADLVILDRDLPGLSGSEVLAGIRASDHKVKVIILTGYDDPGDAEKYRKSGANAFLSKSDGLSNVLTEVDRLLGAPAQRSADPAEKHPAEREESRILVADDDESFRTMLTRYLASQGYKVEAAADGDAALDAVKRSKPDIVLLDIAMPGKDGMEVLKELAKNSPDTGVLMITGNEEEDLARACLKNGAFDYLAKPFNLECLATIVKTRLLVQRKGDR